ncbi:type VI secretion system tube protein Hcp [Cocleimonas sp. KMM 6892]|uniref:Hcp family type VI secretion system effector n=1 Tax=unclassified Cocleimonas TaxID=2639732 RepID=UPI002DBE01EC|nr:MULTISPECIES: type VI secretion system tube protein Hcp [unclassified Cocleimonas]MEB8434461.1 type VI secretion system tube protein Hcp [Cocleimonas sp. KMM 6892]MEC4717354.1 type VI secretion system tube protein Hcp [Cocleimonas sp. KMM 6895]MEC4746733.1 type VI secretion system tube protein Hcp [Cocleimonas sp. KMM 6896]
MAAFLKIDGIGGEAHEDNHKDWIDILSFSAGITQPVSAAGRTGGRTNSVAEFQHVCINKVMDKSTPNLALYCSNGQHIPKAEIEFVLDSEEKHVYMKYTLSDVIISSYNINASFPGDDRPSEGICLAFGKIEQEYKPIDKTGKGGASFKSGWDLEAGKKV